MPDAQPSAQPTLDHLLHTVEQLPTEELTEFVRRMISDLLRELGISEDV